MERRTASTPVEQPALCLLVVMIGGALLGFAMHLGDFSSHNSHKPLVSLLTLSWFPWALTKLHPIESRNRLLGAAILVAFIGWDAMARIVNDGMGC